MIRTAAKALTTHGSEKSGVTSYWNSQWVGPNDLLKSIEYDINEKVYLAEIRVLGIIDKIITGPMWRLFASEGGILSQNPYLELLYEKLQKWGKDASSLLEGEPLFMDIPVHDDDVYQCLFRDVDPEFDSLTQMAL